MRWVEMMMAAQASLTLVVRVVRNRFTDTSGGIEGRPLVCIVRIAKECPSRFHLLVEKAESDGSKM